MEKRTPHVLIAMNEFTDAHMGKIADCLEGWATWERIDALASAELYAARLKTAQIAAGWPQPEWVRESRLHWLQLGSVGFENYLSAASAHPDFRLCNASGVMSVPVAEQFIAMLFGLARRLPHHKKDQLERRWRRQPVYDEIAGSTVCIVGVGDIGTEMARRCLALGMNVIGVRRNARIPHPIIERLYPLDRLDQAIAQADHVVLIMPSTPDTLGLFDDGMFGRMKRGAYFYNLARGSLVDEAALIRHLRSGHLAGAGLDVFACEPLPGDSELWTFDNVIVTPHSGGRSVKEFDRICNLFVENLQVKSLDLSPLGHG